MKAGLQNFEFSNNTTLLLDSVSDVIVSIDLNFQVQVWNKEAERFYGIPASGAYGKNFNDLVHLTFYDTTIQQVLKDVEKDKIWKGITSYQTVQGDVKYLNNTIQYLTNTANEEIGYLSVGNDISEKRKAEENLKKSEQFYRTLIADSLDVTLLMDADGKITFTTPSIQHILGFEVNEVVGKSAFDFVHPDDASWAFDSFQREVAENPQIKFIIVRLRKKSGEWLWCMVRGHNLLSNPYVNKIAVYFHDDSLRRKATEALRESEKRFRSMIKELQIGVLLQDNTGKILMSNNAMEKIFGVTEELLLGGKIWEFFTEVIDEEGSVIKKEDRPTFKALHTKQRVADMVVGVRHPQTSELIWLLLSADPILDEQENILHVISSFINITERKKLENKILTKQVYHQKQLTQATIDGQEKERLEIGKELHDNIGQQLTTVKLFLDLAKVSADEATLETVSLASKGVASLINDVRSLSRSLVPSTLNDLGLIDAIQDLIEPIIKMQHIAIHFEYENFIDLGLSENQKLALFRIVQEQMNNIVKHASAKNVYIQLESTPHEIFLLVKDNGIGFDLKKVRKGIGFSNIISRSELIGGSAEIASFPGNGCSMKVAIPFAIEQPV